MLLVSARMKHLHTADDICPQSSFERKFVGCSCGTDLYELLRFVYITNINTLLHQDILHTLSHSHLKYTLLSEMNNAIPQLFR